MREGQRPRVSVGMPVYNRERFVGAAIESVLAQTYRDFELIISDNASGDGTPDICAAYAARDPRVRFVRQPRNQGGAWNFNHVFDLSRGEYFKLAADDDLLGPDLLARCVEALDRDPTVVLAYGVEVLIDEAGTVLAERPCGIATSHRPHERFRDAVMQHHYAQPLFGLARAETLRRTALYRPHALSAQAFLSELALYGRFQEVREARLYLREHPNRSGNVNPTLATLAGWWGAGRPAGAALPRWHLFADYCRAVWRAPLEPGERARCFAHVARRACERWRGPLEDVVVSARRLARMDRGEPSGVAH